MGKSRNMKQTQGRDNYPNKSDRTQPSRPGFGRDRTQHIRNIKNYPQRERFNILPRNRENNPQRGENNYDRFNQRQRQQQSYGRKPRSQYNGNLDRQYNRYPQQRKGRF